MMGVCATEGISRALCRISTTGITVYIVVNKFKHELDINPSLPKLGYFYSVATLCIQYIYLLVIYVYPLPPTPSEMDFDRII